MSSAPIDRRSHPPGLAISRWAAPDGWAMRRYDLPAAAGAPRGSILFQTGRSDFIEKYIETIAHWSAAGWGVSGFDWRGQGGSGRVAREVLAGNVEDLATFVAEWQATAPRPHILIGHSMGGFLLLDYLARHRPAVDGAVLVAPMLGLNAYPLTPQVAAKVAGTLASIGLADRRGWSDDKPGRAARLTHSADRYADEVWWKKHTPEIALGPPTWRWIAEAYRATAALLRPDLLGAIETPMLIVAARNDRLVDFAAIERAAAMLPHSKLIVSDDAAHELLREADAQRAPALAAIDQFLEAIAGNS